MPRFDPQPGTQVHINALAFEVMPHPAASTMAFGQEGRKAVVYQVRNGDRLFALKIFKEQFRSPQLAEICTALFQLRSLTGLEVCERMCLTTSTAPELLRQFPEMEFAVLMPWITGKTWFDIVFGAENLPSDTTRRLANYMARVLASLEVRGLAHCDVAGANVVVNPQQQTVSLIDVEDMYGSSFTLDDAFPAGTQGYQHRIVRRRKRGQWCAEGDRFAGAILLAEMLTWHHAAIRNAADEEHFFGANEMHNVLVPKYKLMIEVLNEFSTEVATLFTQAWTSTSLAHCPPLTQWASSLSAIMERPAPPPATSKKPVWGDDLLAPDTFSLPKPTGLTAQELIEKLRAEAGPKLTIPPHYTPESPPSSLPERKPPVIVAPPFNPPVIQSEPLLSMILRRAFLLILLVVGWGMLLWGAVAILSIFSSTPDLLFPGLIVFFIGLWLARRVPKKW